MHFLPGSNIDAVNASFAGKAGGVEALQENAQAANKANADKEITFGDVLDVVNPLQHIPGVSALYRDVTGDEISGTASVIGGTLYGGPAGLLASGMSAVMAEESGKTPGEHVVAMVTGGGAAAQADGDAGNTVARQSDGVRATTANRAEPSAADTGNTGGASESAAMAALPKGMANVLPPAPASAQARQDGVANATAGSTGNASAQAGVGAQGADATADARGARTRSGGDDEVLNGENALAAFARDMQAVGEQAAQDKAAAARTVARDDQASRSASAAGNARNAGPDAESQQQAAANQDFMTLRDSDYNTSAEMRARSERLDELQAKAVDSVQPRVDPQSSVLRESSTADNEPTRADGRTADDAPPDFADRMKNALQKYRQMHNTK